MIANTVDEIAAEITSEAEAEAEGGMEGNVGMEGAGEGDGGGDGGGGKVICTELHRQGLLSNEIYKADSEYGKTLPEEALRGYHLWAIPIAKAMRKSKLLTKIVLVFAKPWALEMAFRMGIRRKGHFIGKVMLILGVPICSVIGKIIYGLERKFIYSSLKT